MEDTVLFALFFKKRQGNFLFFSGLKKKDFYNLVNMFFNLNYEKLKIYGF